LNTKFLAPALTVNAKPPKKNINDDGRLPPELLIFGLFTPLQSLI
jgi:hypothetical protein